MGDVKVAGNPLVESLAGLVDMHVPEGFVLQHYTPLPEGQTLDRCDPAEYAPQFVQPSVTEVHRELVQEKDAAVEASSALLAPDAERDPLHKISYDEKWDARTRERRSRARPNAGKGWYGLPATKITPEILAQMQLIHMRKFVFVPPFFVFVLFHDCFLVSKTNSLLDPTRAFKKVKKTFQAPKYFEIGTVIPGAADHYTTESKKKRSRTIVQQVLDDHAMRERIRTRFAKLVASKQHFTNKHLNRIATQERRRRRAVAKTTRK